MKRPDLQAAFWGYYRRQMMRPGPAAVFLNPFFFARRGLYAAMQEIAQGVSGDLLDVGCGSRPYEHLFPAARYVGLELDTAKNRAADFADAYYDGGRFPFDDASFDAVLCNEVLEHAFEPDRLVAEMARVLRPGGRLLLTVPFAWDEHEQPADYGRYTSFGLAHLLGKHGFRVRLQRKTMADARAVFQLLNAYLYRVVWTRHPYLNVVLTACVMAPVTIAGCLAGWLLPANPDFYLDNVVLAERHG